MIGKQFYFSLTVIIILVTNYPVQGEMIPSKSPEYDSGWKERNLDYVKLWLEFNMEYHQFITRSGTIIYLDVETGGLFSYFLYGLGLFHLGLGIIRYNRDGKENLDSKELSF